MAGSSDVIVRFIADASQVTRASSEVEGAGNRLKSWAKGVGAAIGVAFAVNQVKDWVNAAMEAEAANARLTQTLKNAGDAHGKWAARASELATTLMKQTGIDDEVIKGGQSILATFHDVSGAAAQQAGIFDRATKAAVDLSKAGFGDVESASKSLGKALQDPEKGLAALGRAGVQFTQAQKDQIAAMLEAGDKLGAQKIILAEVESQVGGVAAKTATAGDKMKVAWGEAKESLGAALLPMLKELTPILITVANTLQRFAPILVPVAGIIATIVVAVKAATLAQLAWNIAMDANPIGAIVMGIVALIAIIVVIIRHWDDIKAAAEAAWNAILAAVQFVWNWIKDNWPLILAILTGPFGIAVGLIIKYRDQIWDAIKFVWQWIQDNWPLLAAILAGPFGIAVYLIVGHWDEIKAAVSDAIGFIAGIMGGVVDILVAPFRNAYEIIRGIIEDIKGLLGGIGSKITDAIGKATDLADKLNPFALPPSPPHGVASPLPAMATPFALAAGMPTTGTAVGRVMPRARMPAPSRTYNLTVNVAAGTDPAQTGRTIVDLIRSYERANGASWRTG